MTPTEKIIEILKSKDEELRVPLIKRSFSEGHITSEQYDELIDTFTPKKVNKEALGIHGDISDIGSVW